MERLQNISLIGINCKEQGQLLMSSPKRRLGLITLFLLMIGAETCLGQHISAISDDWEKMCVVDQKIGGVNRKFFCFSDRLNYLVKIGALSELKEALILLYHRNYRGGVVLSNDGDPLFPLKNALANRPNYSRYFNQEKGALYDGHEFFMGQTAFDEDFKKYGNDEFLMGIPGLVLLAKKYGQKEILAFLLSYFGNDNLRKLANDVAVSSQKAVTRDFAHKLFFEKSFFEKAQYRKEKLSKGEISSIKRFFKLKYRFSTAYDIESKIDLLLELGFPAEEIVDDEGNNLLSYFNTSRSYKKVKELYESRRFNTQHLNTHCSKELQTNLQTDRIQRLRRCQITADLIVPNERLTVYEYAWKKQLYNIFYFFYKEKNEYPKIEQSNVNLEKVRQSLTDALDQYGLDQATKQHIYTQLKDINYASEKASSQAIAALQKYESHNKVDPKESSSYQEIPTILRQHNFLRVDDWGTGYIGKIEPNGKFKEKKVLQLESCGLWQRFFSKNKCYASFINYYLGSLFFTDDTLYSFSNDREKGRFVKKLEGKILAVAALPAHLLVAHGEKLTIFDEKLNAVSSFPAPCQAIVKMIYDDKIVYLLGEKSIVLMKQNGLELSVVDKLDFDIPNFRFFDFEIAFDANHSLAGFSTLSEYRDPGIVAKTYDSLNRQGEMLSSRLISYNSDAKLNLVRLAFKPSLFIEEKGEGHFVGQFYNINFPKHTKTSGAIHFSFFSQYISIADRRNVCVFGHNDFSQPLWCGVK